YIQRAHDDGEPSGTAGIPMLEVLKKKELKNVAAVVTRYFGGTKLGAGGLIRAYGGAVTHALDQVGLVETIPHVTVSVQVDYTLSGSLENNLREANYSISAVDYTDKVTYLCQVDTKQLAVFYEEVTEWTNGRAVFQKGGINYMDRPIQS
ncbi:MAG: IMPACT family protein, partial [Pisciglobus halotolerans]|nr:IMPACT family protein [Pisciglobus halotolerans]